MNPVSSPKVPKWIFLTIAVPVLLGLYPASKLFHGADMDGTAIAQEPTPGAEHPLVVSFAGRDVELANVLQSFAQQVDAELALSPEVHGQLSLQLSRARLESAMNDLCTAYSCTWALNDEPRQLVVRPATDK
jgi:hypothetical protein